MYGVLSGRKIIPLSQFCNYFWHRLWSLLRSHMRVTQLLTFRWCMAYCWRMFDASRVDMRSMCVCVCYCGCSAAIMDPFTPLIYLCICIRVFLCVRVCRHTPTFTYVYTLSRTHTRKHSCTQTYVHTRMRILMYSKTYLFIKHHKQAEVKRHMMHKTLLHAATHWQAQVMQRHTVHQLDNAQFAHACMVARELHLSCFPSSSCCPVKHTHTHLHTLACARANKRAHAGCQSCQRSHRRSSVWNSTTKFRPTASLYIAAPYSPRTARSDRCVCVCLSLVFIFSAHVYISLASPMRSCICGYACRCMGFECLWTVLRFGLSICVSISRSPCVRLHVSETIYPGRCVWYYVYAHTLQSYEW